MRRREFILGLAILTKVGRASAQDRVRRVGALIAEPSASDVLETSLREKKRLSERRGGYSAEISRSNIE